MRIGEQISTASLQQTVKEKKVTCMLCSGNHAVGKCNKLENLSMLPSDEKDEIVRQVRAIIKKTGIAGLSEESIQKVFGQLSQDKEKFQAIVDELVSRHQLGSFGETNNGKNEKIFTGAEFITGNGKIKINKNPIGFDRDLNQYVLRHNFIRGDGSVDPAVRVSPISSIINLKTQEKKKIAA